MAKILKIVTAEHPLIRKKLSAVKTIDNRIKELIEDMRKTVINEQDPEGVGLAANQVGVDSRVYLAKIGKEFVAFINPEIITYSKEMAEQFEGCLSITDYFGFVTRAKEVTVRYTTEKGKVGTKSFKGLAARIMQHELDHLNGRLFIDHVAVQSKEVFKYLGNDEKGEPKFEKYRLDA